MDKEFHNTVQNHRELVPNSCQIRALDLITKVHPVSMLLAFPNTAPEEVLVEESEAALVVVSAAMAQVLDSVV